ncbi:hypothetical protein [Hwangdonia lutea]|uniref:Uncharacterized protein n=1 Tax=Hwangdonia lutea TaxID=3075823 RepID=A0AA97EL34_9FLAO|nr:hypothetical protein [Hwangdonia sp. SCSIO 19198]WOD43421.1 hypothetical protein RNZ46_15640 [Hwangdonia sp. SCSIO 19198]
MLNQTPKKEPTNKKANVNISTGAFSSSNQKPNALVVLVIINKPMLKVNNIGKIKTKRPVFLERL